MKIREGLTKMKEKQLMLLISNIYCGLSFVIQDTFSRIGLLILAVVWLFGSLKAK
jgi:hypothetical protein